MVVLWWSYGAPTGPGAQLRKELQCIVAASTEYKGMVNKGLAMQSFRASFHEPWVRKIRKTLNPIILNQVFRETASENEKILVANAAWTWAFRNTHA